MQHFQRDQAVSPVVAVILMVAVTVILSAVIGTFVLNIGQSTTDTSNQPSIGVSTSLSNGQYTATIITGSADEVRLLVNGTEVDNVTGASAGDTLTANISEGDRVTIITVDDGQTTVTSSQTVSSTSKTTGTKLVVTDGLVSNWKLNGDVTDSWGTNDGTNNGVLFTDGVDNQAGQFEGGSTYVDLGDPANLNASSLGGGFTVSTWVKFKNLSPSVGKQFIVAHGSDSANDNIVIHTWDSGGDGTIEIQFYADNTGSSNSATSSTSVVTGKWYHLVGVWNGSDGGKLYINATLDASNASMNGALNTASASPWAIGSRGGDSKFVNGTIDDTRVYNRTLNSSEISTLYNETK